MADNEQLHFRVVQVTWNTKVTLGRRTLQH